jgi:hypothetical protein
MHESIDQLTETFTAHENLAPDAGDVLAKANALARIYCRRRRAAQATGASVLGVGLVAGTVALPRVAWRAQSHGGGTVVQAGSGGGLPALGGAPSATHRPSVSATPSAPASPSPTATPRVYTQQQELEAYFAAGYNYDNALQLAALWNATDTDTAKAAAGLKLLEGNALPVMPSGTPATPQEKALSAFFDAGYDYNDALTLGTLWHETDVTQIKTEAGQKLLDGQTLPIVPSTPVASSAASVVTGSASTGSPALDAYFAAGYNYNDALTLGTMWHETDIAQIKAEAGQKLLDGQTLPIAP